MLRHGHYATGFCRVGSASVPSRAAVRAWRIAGSGGAGVGRYPSHRPPLVSRMESEGASGAQGGRPSRAQTAPRGDAAREGGPGPAGRPPRPWLQHRPVDPAESSATDRARDWRSPSSGACVAHPAQTELVAAAAGPPGAGTRRAGNRPVEDAALAAAKKNARRRRAWLVFEDESGVSQHPVVCRTWAPRGETPVLIHVGASWKRLSVAGALAFRWDGRRARFFFHTQPGTYTDVALLAFLRNLKRHFRRQRVMLIWDGLAAHKSRAMLAYLARQRTWLTVERLPAYAPELSPVEP